MSFRVRFYVYVYAHVYVLCLLNLAKVFTPGDAFEEHFPDFPLNTTLTPAGAGQSCPPSSGSAGGGGRRGGTRGQNGYTWTRSTHREIHCVRWP